MVRKKMNKEEYERFFASEFSTRFFTKLPCEDTEYGCEDQPEGTLVDGFEFANRLIIYIEDWENVVFYRQEDDTNNFSFEFGIDIFRASSTYEAVRKLAESWIYIDDVIIFSPGKDAFMGEDMNIGEIISKVIKEQENLLKRQAENRLASFAKSSKGES